MVLGWTHIISEQVPRKILASPDLILARPATQWSHIAQEAYAVSGVSTGIVGPRILLSRRLQPDMIVPFTTPKRHVGARTRYNL